MMARLQELERARGDAMRGPVPAHFVIPPNPHDLVFADASPTPLPLP
jgi:hypothetical protein